VTPRESGIQRAEEVAKKLNRRFGVTAREHIKVELYPAALGMKLVFGKLDGARARLGVGREPVIRISDEPCDPGDLNFRIGHEIGHHVLRHPPMRIHPIGAGEQVFQPARAGNARHFEAEANTVSAGLCLPAELLSERIEYSIPNLDVAHSIASEYTMPLAATTIRFAELTRQRCAAVYSEHGRIVWAVPSTTFDAKLPKGKKLAPGSIAYEYANGGKHDDRQRVTRANAWIAADVREEIVEHSTVVAPSNGVVSLLWLPIVNRRRWSR
jgi:hypothetical protein